MVPPGTTATPTATALTTTATPTAATTTTVMPTTLRWTRYGLYPAVQEQEKAERNGATSKEEYLD